MTTQNQKVALITGANKGLGLEAARRLGLEGFTVLIGARGLEKANSAVEQLKAQGVADALPVLLDVTDEAQVQAAAAMIQEKFGKLDVLINNAGIQIEGGWGTNTVLTGSLEEWRQTFETNVFGLLAVTQATMELLRAAPAARIVNVSSVLGSLTLHAKPNNPMRMVKPAAYDASKAAVNAITIHLAQALEGTAIKVNSAHPGWVKTDLGTDAAPLSVEEGAQTLVQLALLGEDGPQGGFFHNGDSLPW